MTQLAHQQQINPCESHIARSILIDHITASILRTILCFCSLNTRKFSKIQDIKMMERCLYQKMQSKCTDYSSD
uniref:Uncharacterized protein n=1 Tax=Anguilla anguilla TaxID=7936 RepID=A0A0E9RYE1_ANGAN